MPEFQSALIAPPPANGRSSPRVELRRERAARAAAEASLHRLVQELEAITSSFVSLDREWRFTFLNRAAEQMLGVSREELLGRSIWEAFPGAVGSVFHREYHRAMREQVPVSFEAPSTLRPDLWMEVRAYPTPTGLSIHTHDVTERRRAEAAQRVLAEAGKLLGASLDPARMLEELAEMAVRELADWCFVDLVEDDGAIRRVATAPAGTERAALAERLRLHPPHPDGPSLGARVLRSGLTCWIPEVAPADLRAMSAGPEHLRTLEALGVGSVVAVPLVARGRAVGVLGLTRAPGAPAFHPDEVRLAEELGRRAALALDGARLFRQAQQAVGARERVLRIVSHDLRNPLGAVMAHADLLLEALPGTGAERERRWSTTIRRAAEQMNRLIGDLMEMSAVESERLVVRCRPVRPALLAREALELLEPLARERGVELRGDVAASLPAVQADPERVLQVLSNLIGNALSFTPAGGCVTLAAAEGPAAVRFSVSDTGPGIPEEEIPRVFEPYWRGRRSVHAGTGLGLAIVKGIVEAHGGAILCESRAGQGATFHFSLPLPGAEAAVGTEVKREAQGSHR